MQPQHSSKSSWSPLKRILFVLVGLVAALLLAFAALLSVLTIFEYDPAPTEAVAVQPAGSDAPASRALAAGDSVDILSWNIGYCGLSEEADFFMDGGSGVRTVSRDGVLANLAGVERVAAEQDADIVLLQEVDCDSSRSYHIDEAAALLGSFAGKGYSSAFAPNYMVPFVPYPVPPIGKVNSGILTLSRLESDVRAERVQLPCPFDWPIRLGNLKRCLLVERVPVSGADADGASHELVLINLHLEAYDDGAGKAAQTAQLVEFMRSEYEKGNYVVAGGDFNQTFSTVDTGSYPVQKEGLWECGYLGAETFGDGFSMLMDHKNPTCRSLDRPYDASDPTFQYYMIDGFVVSSNVRVDALETLDTGFDFSDHNPVRVSVTLL